MKYRGATQSNTSFCHIFGILMLFVYGLHDLYYGITPISPILTDSIIVVLINFHIPYGSPFNVLGNSVNTLFPSFSFILKIGFVRYLSAIRIS